MYTERCPICLLIIYVLQAELEHSVVIVVNPAQCGTAMTTTSTTPSLMIVQPKYEAKELWKFTVGDIFFLNMHQLARGTTITTSTSHGIQVEWNFRRRNRRERSSYKDDFSLFGNEPFKNWIELSTTERGGHVTKSLWMEFILLEWWVVVHTGYSPYM